MAQAPKPDVLAELDHLLAAGGTTAPPWRKPAGGTGEHERTYVPDYAMLRDLLAVPIEKGHARSQQSGRVAKSLDAYIAYELRRAGFDAASVFPRAKQPRVLPPEFAETEQAIESLLRLLADHEAVGGRLQPPDIRSYVNRLARSVPGISETKVLGRFYSKQVDAVVLSDWLRGPDVLVSGKTQFSSYPNNKNNRYEEAIGEAHNLRDRYPLAAMGFVFLVRSNVFEGGSYELLRDLLVRLRRPDGPFDGTVLLVADWDETSLEFRRVEDPAPALALPRFFEDLLGAVMSNTPVDIHQRVRAAKLGEPRGGFPPSDEITPAAPAA
jgi:hypothetical protein